MVRVESDVLNRPVVYLEKWEFSQNLKDQASLFIKKEALEFVELLRTPAEHWGMGRLVVTDAYMHSGNEDATQYIGVGICRSSELEELAVLSNKYLEEAVSETFDRKNLPPGNLFSAVWNTRKFDEMNSSLAAALENMLEGKESSYDATLLMVDPKEGLKDVLQGNLYVVCVPSSTGFNLDAEKFA